MDQKTRELKESSKCDTLRLKRIKLSSHKRTIVSESNTREYILQFDD